MTKTLLLGAVASIALAAPAFAQDTFGGGSNQPPPQQQGGWPNQ